MIFDGVVESDRIHQIKMTKLVLQNLKSTIAVHINLLYEVSVIKIQNNSVAD